MEDDRISKLPDEIICHIISFLPSEDAFATRLLSKRWKSLWLLYPSPNLDFDVERFFRKEEPYISFKGMVNVTINERSEHQPIKSFRLRCHTSLFECPVWTWLTAAAKRGVKHIDVHMSDTWTWNVTSSIFCSSNLVVLKLKVIHFNCFISFNLPSLKTLHLNSVHFIDNGHAFGILNACPILEDLEIKDISISVWFDEVEENEEVKKLTNLTRADVSSVSIYGVELEAFSNVAFLRLEEMYGAVPVFSKLTILEIVFGKSINWFFIASVMKNCPILHSLLLDMPLIPNILSSYMEAALPSVNWFPDNLPECLSLQFKRCTITNYRGQKYELQFVQNILLNATSLESMRIYSSPSLDDQEKLDMTKELLAIPRSSVICGVYFE